jgi:hypothetical protein
LRAQPEWYALLLTRTLVGDRPLPTTISAEGSPNLVAASFSGPDRSLKVVLADNEAEGTSGLALRLDVGAGMGVAHVIRLSAPSQSTTEGVLLAGRAVTADGWWHAPIRTEAIATHSGILAFELAPGSAALLTVSRSQAKPPHHGKAHRRV